MGDGKERQTRNEEIFIISREMGGGQTREAGTKEGTNSSQCKMYEEKICNSIMLSKLNQIHLLAVPCTSLGHIGIVRIRPYKIFHNLAIKT